MFSITTQAVEKIHQEALRVLATTGVKVTHPEMQEVARSHGAVIEADNIKIPIELATKLLSQAPATFKVSGLSGQIYQIGGKKKWVMAITNDPWIIDYATQQPRRPILSDVIKHTVTGQKLDKVYAMSCMDFPMADIRGESSSFHALEAHLLHTDKHLYVYAASESAFDEWKNIWDILQTGPAQTGRIASVAVAVISPLVISDFNIDMLLEACKRNFVVVPTICPMAGTTSPGSLAGTLLLGHTENLAICILTQMIRSGNPFLYTFGPSATDMSNGESRYYTLDKVLWKSAAMQLKNLCHLPMTSECGGTMSSSYDPQCGAEGILLMLSSYYGGGIGAEVLAGFGSCYNANGMSAEMMVIHDSYFAASQFLTQGMKITDEELGFDNIKNVGCGGNYLDDELTFTHLRDDEFFHHALFDLSGKAGGKAILDRAHQQVEALSATCELALPLELQPKIRAYFAEFYARNK